MEPLERITVVDASWGMPGAVASMLLADCGARVIKVERPDPAADDFALDRLAWERGKESIVLDVAQASDREVLRGLLAHADIYIESF
ncbi:MAG: CoA transferase, partial [Steroidobacteraceae bacterium]|nr:CoA transferase [Steroidobacteraceae bacterium]